MSTSKHDKNETESDILRELIHSETEIETDEIGLNESTSQLVTSEEMNQMEPTKTKF